MSDLEYKTLLASERFGRYGGFGIKILIATEQDTYVPSYAVNSAANKAAAQVLSEVQAETVAINKDAQEAAKKERQHLLDLFTGRIFAEAIPNGYCSDWCCRHLPWFIVTTEIGRFKIGWRKRVIHLEWTETVGTKTADELFPDEDSTKGDRYIHAWSYEKAQQYIAAITTSAVDNSQNT